MTAPALIPLSLDRTRGWFADNGWNYEIGERFDLLRTGFAGIALEIKAINNALAVVSTVAVDTVTADRFDEVLSWVETYNSEHAFPSVFANKDVKRNVAAVGVTYAMPGSWDYSDQQFEAHLTSGIEGVTGAVRAFLSAFAPEVVETIDSRLAQASE